MKIMRPALRYHGGKWKLGPWIISFFPQHDCYVEPFGGGASVLLQKGRSWLECYNDADGNVVNFFRVLRDEPARLVEQIRMTPYAKAEWEQALEDAEEPMERARRFYIRSFMSIAGPTAQWNTGWRRQKALTRNDGGVKRMKPAALCFMDVDHLHQAAERFRGVQIEQDLAVTVMERYDTAETLFYLDPPYPASTRGRWKDKAYAVEMSDEDHRELARAATNLQGMVVLSGYRCDLYDELFGEWRRFDREARVNGPGSVVESVWLSPRTVAAWERQMPLFGGI